MEKEQKIQEEEYYFPYHYGSLLAKHRGIPYNFTINKIISLIQKDKYKKIAEVGCGDAFFIYNFKIKNGLNITGYDYSKKSLGFARAFNPKIDFRDLDITKNELLEKYDLILCQDVIEHLPLDKLLDSIKNLENSLNQEGYLIISVPTTNIPVSDKHYQHFTKEKLQQYFKNFKLQNTIYLHKKEKIHSKIFLLQVWLCYITYPLSVTFAKKIYSIILKNTKKYYKKYLLQANEKNSKNIIVVFKKEEHIKN